MTWTETHRRWQVLRDVEAVAQTDDTGSLPWREEYADVFGDRAGLLAALRYRWDLARQAQLDPDLPEAVEEASERALRERFAGVLRILARYEVGVPIEGGLARAS